MATDKSEDAKLVERFRQLRDERAFRDLYRRHSPVLYALARRFTCSDVDAQEALQETWIRAVGRLDSFQWRSTLRTWLTGILVNCCREQRRRHARAPEMLDEDRHVLAGPAPPIADRLDVERAIASLPDGYREVLVLYAVEGYSHREIADMLGVAEGTCKSQLSRARRSLRAMLFDRDKAAQETRE